MRLAVASFVAFTAISISSRFVEGTASDIAENVTSPLIYTRLRFEHDFLQIYRRFQKHLKLDEKKLTIELKSPVAGDEPLSDERKNASTKTAQKLVYYENSAIESTNLTLDDLIFEALDRAYLTRLMPAYVYNYDNHQDLQKASDSKLISRAKCQRDLRYLMTRLNSLQIFRESAANQINAKTHSPELLALFDSIAGEETGLLFGNYHWLGNWRQCSRRQIFDLNREYPADSISFNGRYCTASIRSKEWAEKAAQRIPELKSKHFKYPEQEYDYKRFFRIQIGICLPEACDSRSFAEHRAEIKKLATFKLGEPLRSYELVDLFCLPDETSELRQVEQSGRLWIGLAICWCLAVILATIVDLYTTNRPVQLVDFADKLVSSLSLAKNFDRLIETDSLGTPHFRPARNEQPKNDGNKSSRRVPATNESTFADATQQPAKVKTSMGKVRLLNERNKLAPNDLLFINAIKVISMPLILFGHSGMLIIHLDRYVLDYHGLNSDFVFHFLASTVFYVDWFFVISGFLTTYLMFVTKKVERHTTVQWLYTLFHRYWRLAPIYLLLFWFSKSVFMYTGRGPNWDYGTSNMTLRAICRRESWLYPLTLTSNLHPIHEECIMPAWYLACDMQFYIITPLILILLHKSPLLGWLVSLGAIGACISLRLHRYLSDPRAQPLELMRPRSDLYMRNNWDMHATYVYPQYRIATYLIGILAGHYTYKVLGGEWRSPIYYSNQSQQRARSPRSSRGGASQSASGDNGRNASTNSSQPNFVVWLRTLSFFFGCQLLLTMMFATWPISDLFPVSMEKHVKYFTALVYALDHATAGLGMALFLTTIMLGQFKWLRSVMSHPNWTVLSRVNFAAFLIQVELIYWLVQSADRTIEMSTLELIKLFCYLSCFTYLIAFVLTLLLEFPLAQLERRFVAPHFISTERPQAAYAANPASKQPDNELAQLCSSKHQQVA